MFAGFSGHGNSIQMKLEIFFFFFFFFLQKNRPKPNKKDLPQNYAFYCDVCDRGFPTEEKSKEHIDQHEKVSYKFEVNLLFLKI